MPASIRADIASHLMHLGVRDYENGKLNAKPVTCMGWMYFKNKLDLEEVKKITIEKQVKKIFRYHALPVEVNGWTEWQDIGIENIDYDYHFQHVEGFETEKEWEKFLEDEANKGVDFNKPWWRFIIVDKTPSGRSAVVSILDHAFADGASSVSALLQMCEKGGKNPVFSGKSNKSKSKARYLTIYERFLALYLGISQPITEQLFSNDMITKCKQPTGVFPKAWNFATTPCGEHLNIDKIKEIKTRIPGATVNDVMLTLTALSIRAYYSSINEPIMKSGNDIRGTLAINTRPNGVDYLSDEYFGNHIVVGTSRYPLHETRLKTLCSFRDDSRLRKAGPDTLVRQYLMKAFSFLPRDKVVELAAEASCKFSIMISNVCFSLTPLKLFGQEIDDVRFIAQSPLGLYIGAATYCEKVSFCAVATEDTGSDPKSILSFMKTECDKLYEEVMAVEDEEIKKLDKPKTLPVPMYFVLAFLLAVFSGFFKY